MSLCKSASIFISSVSTEVQEILSSLHAFGMGSTNYGSVVSTLIAAMVLFAIKEFYNKASSYSGVFFTYSVAESTTYNPYRGLQTFHTLVLFSDGHVVSGTSEKTGDINLERKYEYPGASKIRGVVTGVVERNYIRSSVLNIHIVEEGADRQITTYMSIKFQRYGFKKLPFHGEFYSTAASTKGRVLCGRERFNEHPIGHLPLQSMQE